MDKNNGDQLKRPIALLALTGVLLAAAPGTIGHPGAFTWMLTDARSAALGGALVADINSGSLAFTNPASVVYLERRELGLSLLTLPLDRSSQSLSIAFSLPPTAAVAISYSRVGDQNIIGRNSIGQRTGTIGYAEGMAALSFSNQITPRLSLGLTVKLLNISLADEAARGMAVDGGLLYYTESGLAGGLLFRNLTGSYAWKIPDGDQLHQYDEHLPFIMSLAGRLPWRTFTLYAQTDLVRPRYVQDSKVAYADMVPQLRIGIENIAEERFALRGGLEHNQPTFGVGLLFTIRNPADSRVDYALVFPTSSEGYGHFFTWKWSR